MPTERVQEWTTRNSQSYEQGKRRLVMARLQMIRGTDASNNDTVLTKREKE